MKDEHQPVDSVDGGHGNPTDDERRFGAAVDALVSAILALDEEDAFQRVDALANGLADGDASELALYLGEWYSSEPDTDGPEVRAIRKLFLAALVRLGMRLSVPEYAEGLADAAEAALFEDHDPSRAAEVAARAVALANDSDVRAVAGAFLAIALSSLDDEAGALAAALRANAEASDKQARLLARAALLSQFDSDDSTVTSLAVEGLQWCHGYPDHLWAVFLAGEAIRLLLADATRHEKTKTPPPDDVAQELTAALAYPQWTPDFLTHADLAALVAWTNVLRDDFERLEEVLTIAEQGPHSSPLTAAYTALLGVLVPYRKSDIEEMERRLHRAAPIVEAADDPGLKESFRAIAMTITAPLRGGDFVGAINRLDHAGIPDATALLLLGRAFEAVQALAKQGIPIPSEITDGLNAWCDSGRSASVPATEVALWIMGGVVASMTGDRTALFEREARARSLFAALPTNVPQRQWLQSMLGGLSGGMHLMDDWDAGLEEVAALHGEHVRANRAFQAFIAAAQLSVGHLNRGRHAEALRFGVGAMAYLVRHRAVLAGSSERHALRKEQELVYATTLEAAAGLRDPIILAELLEYLRAQDMPIILERPDPTQIPLDALLAIGTAGGPFGVQDPAHSLDAVQLAAPRPVRMPWGTTALATWGAPAGGQPVQLMVARCAEGPAFHRGDSAPD